MQLLTGRSGLGKRQYSRRSPEVVPDSGCSTVCLQHGLHVSEALDRVDVLLAEVSAVAAAAGSRRLRLVVGEGRHAAGAARLPAFVKRFLDSRGVAYAEPYAGLLELRL